MPNVRAFKLGTFGLGSGPFKAGVIAALLITPLAGCATVSMAEPKTVTANISIAPQSSQLHKASDAYCDNARRNDWATGETSIGSLAGLLTGRNPDEDVYWKKISADPKVTPVALIGRIRADAGAAARGLGELSGIAQKLMAGSKPSKADVTDFERALIHARQARESFAEALGQLSHRVADEYQPARELDGLDKALASARMVADDLAAARMADTAGRTASVMSAG